MFISETSPPTPGFILQSYPKFILSSYPRLSRVDGIAVLLRVMECDTFSQPHGDIKTFELCTDPDPLLSARDRHVPLSSSSR